MSIQEPNIENDISIADTFRNLLSNPNEAQTIINEAAQKFDNECQSLLTNIPLDQEELQSSLAKLNTQRFFWENIVKELKNEALEFPYAKELSASAFTSSWNAFLTNRDLYSTLEASTAKDSVTTGLLFEMKLRGTHLDDPQQKMACEKAFRDFQLLLSNRSEENFATKYIDALVVNLQAANLNLDDYAGYVGFSSFDALLNNFTETSQMIPQRFTSPYIVPDRTGAPLDIDSPSENIRRMVGFFAMELGLSENYTIQESTDAFPFTTITLESGTEGRPFTILALTKTSTASASPHATVFDADNAYLVTSFPDGRVKELDILYKALAPMHEAGHAIHYYLDRYSNEGFNGIAAEVHARLLPTIFALYSDVKPNEVLSHMNVFNHKTMAEGQVAVYQNFAAVLKDRFTNPAPTVQLTDQTKIELMYYGDSIVPGRLANALAWKKTIQAMKMVTNALQDGDDLKAVLARLKEIAWENN